MTFHFPLSSEPGVNRLLAKRLAGRYLLSGVWPYAVLGAVLLSMNTTANAAGGTWLNGSYETQTSCSRSSGTGKYYVGVCTTKTDDAAENANVIFDGSEGSADYVYGGYVHDGAARANQVMISGGTVNKNVSGGMAIHRSGSGGEENYAYNNLVMVSGGGR
ncbi:hypothetical protein H0A58_09790 [Alcaligenaceae bacterium]|nr:hypothetical protein [Alcaligenaceae bacterium]